MHSTIKIIIAASLLLLSGNAAAILMNNQIYGNSGYTLDDIDVSIQAFQDAVSGKKDRKRLKKARKLDRKVEKLIYKIDSAMIAEKIRKSQKKNRKLTRKEAKLLAILAGYLPELGELLQDDSSQFPGNGLISGNILPPQPDILLPTLEYIPAPAQEFVPVPVTSNHDSSNSQPGTTTNSIPEPSVSALLGLGFAGLLFAGRRRRLQSPAVNPPTGGHF